MRFAPAIAATALLVAGTALAAGKTPEEKLAKILEGRVAGTPVSCIYMPTVRDSQIISGTAIVYDAGNTIYVNRPESGASSLSEDDVLVSRPHNSQLCDVDTVHLKESSTFFPRGFVNLGEFVPYTKVRTSAR